MSDAKLVGWLKEAGEYRDRLKRRSDHALDVNPVPDGLEIWATHEHDVGCADATVVLRWEDMKGSGNPILEAILVARAEAKASAKRTMKAMGVREGEMRRGPEALQAMVKAGLLEDRTPKKKAKKK